MEQVTQSQSNLTRKDAQIALRSRVHLERQFDSDRICLPSN